MSRDLLKATISSAFSKASVKQLEINGLTVYVRGLTGAERVQLQQMATAAQNGGEPVADYKIVALGLCDSDGVRLFDDPEQVAVLDGAVLAKLAQAIFEQSGLTETAVADAEKK